MKKIIPIIMAMLLLTSCTKANGDNMQTETVSDTPKAETAAETTTTAEVQKPQFENSPLEVYSDLNNDGKYERLVLIPDAENEKSVLEYYTSDGKKFTVGSDNPDHYNAMTEIDLRWYDNGWTIIPVLYVERNGSFFMQELVLKFRVENDSVYLERILSKTGLRENYGKVISFDYYDDMISESITKVDFDEHLYSMYVKKEDAPSYARSLVIVKMEKMLYEQEKNISILDTYFDDIDSDGIEEVLMLGKTDCNKLYCFKITGEDFTYCGADGAGCLDYTYDTNERENAGDSYAEKTDISLLWYNDNKTCFPTIKGGNAVSNMNLELSLKDGVFTVISYTCENFADGKPIYLKQGTEVSLKEYRTSCYYITPYKKWHIENMVDTCTKYVSYDMNRQLYDFNGDGYPELLTVYGNYSYDDIECTVRSYGEKKEMGYFISDEDKPIRKYYDKANNEYFYVTEYWSYGMAGIMWYYADKTVFYENDSIKETLAYSEFYYSWGSNAEEREYYLNTCTVNGKDLGLQGNRDNNDVPHKKALEEYLSQYELVDTIPFEPLNEETETELHDRLMEQALKIEQNYLKNPIIAKKNPVGVSDAAFDNDNIRINTNHLEIGINDDLDISVLDEIIKNYDVTTVYIYSRPSDDKTYSFDLDLLSECKNIEAFTFYNVDIDFGKLSKFENLSVLDLSNMHIDLSEVGKLTKLTSLSLDNRYYNVVFDLSDISSLTELTYLEVQLNAKDFNFVKDMKKLRVMYLDCTNESDDYYLPLNDLPSLKVVASNGMGSGNVHLRGVRDDIMNTSIK